MNVDNTEGDWGQTFLWLCTSAFYVITLPVLLFGSLGGLLLMGWLIRILIGV